MIDWNGWICNFVGLRFRGFSYGFEELCLYRLLRFVYYKFCWVWSSVWFPFRVGLGFVLCVLSGWVEVGLLN